MWELYQSALELEPKVPDVFTIMEKAPTKQGLYLVVPTSAFTFKNLLRHYAQRALTSASRHEIGGATQRS